MRKTSLLSLFLLTGLFIFNSVESLAQQTQQDRLRQFSQEKSDKLQNQRVQAHQKAERIGLPVRVELDDGRIIELQRFENDRPVYFETHNLGGAVTSSVDALWPEGDLDLDLTGSSQTLGMWDGGLIRESHQEFEGRAEQKDDATSLSDHATHVGGTMIAAGIEEEARGMSYEANLDAYDWNNDLADAASAAADGMLVSNHSYGLIIGWRYDQVDEAWYWYGNPEISETEDNLYGLYFDRPRDWDEVAYNAPNYQIVQSAGNSRLQGPPNQPVEHYVYDPQEEDWVESEKVRDLDGGPDGFQSIGGRAVAKNVLTVGAVEGIDGGYEEPGDVVMSNFSSWGPTDDGRIKPEIVAKGVGVFSPYSSNDTDYATIQGTSMSSPIVSGTIGLLQELYIELHEQPPLSSTIRALLTHTADEAGLEHGPDYQFGYGLLNAERAAETIQNAAEDEGDLVEELTLNDGDQLEYNISSDGETPIQATIAWTDPAGESLPTTELNPDDIILVNDVDLRIEGPDETVYEPYVLDPDNPDQPAETGDNVVDNIEQVFVEEPEEGDYIVQISHKGDLEDGSQDVSLIVTDVQEAEFDNPFAGGIGISSDPFQIESAEQLDEVRNFMDSHFILTDDIDLEEVDDFEPIGEFIFTDDEIIMDPFEGSFDGNGFAIKNLSIEGAEGYATGLFAMIGGVGVIEDVEFESASIKGNGDRTGTLAGVNLGQIIESHVTGDVENEYSITGGLSGQNQGLIYESSADVQVDGDRQSGGLIGWNTGGGLIENAHAYGDVSGTSLVGGLLGVNNESTVRTSSAEGQVEGDLWVGGLAGDSYFSLVEESFASGEVTGGDQAGGLIGSKNGHLINSYATGAVEAEDMAGGLIGNLYHEDNIGDQEYTVERTVDDHYEFDADKVDRSQWAVRSSETEDEIDGEIVLQTSYSAGSVTAEEQYAGFIGYNSDPDAEIEYTYWDTESSGLTEGVYEGSSEGITGLETDQMTDENAFNYLEGFNFIDLWQLTEEDYPSLHWHDVETVDPPSREVTFRVNMEVQQEMGFFRPDEAGDEVALIGEFNSWDSDDATLESDQEDDYLYTKTIDLPGSEGDEVEYKFKMETGDQRPLPDDGIEILDDDPDINRVIELGEPDEQMELDVVYFSDIEEAEPVFAGGDGTPEEPHQIADSEQLDYVRYFINDHFIQTDDIDLSDYDNFIPIANNAPGNFGGEYDGDGYEISNLSIQAEGESEGVGLFSIIDEDGVVTDLTLTSASVTGDANALGAIAGVNAGEILNVSVDGQVNAHIAAGGIAGVNEGLIYDSDASVEVHAVDDGGGIVGLLTPNSTVMSSTVDGNVNASAGAGGAVGFNLGGLVQDVQSDAEVIGEIYAGGLIGIQMSGFTHSSSAHATVEGENSVGGLIGELSEGEINLSYSDNYVQSESSAGGIVGMARGLVKNSYTVSEVHADVFAGGIAGMLLELGDDDPDVLKTVELDESRPIAKKYAEEIPETDLTRSEISNSYTAAQMETVQESGAFVGLRLEETDINKSYFNSGISNHVEPVGEGSAEGVKELSVAEMQQAGSFEDWDFDEIWSIEEGESFPYLKDIGTPFDVPETDIQIVHNSADPSIEEIEFIIDGQIEEQINFRSATDFRSIDPGNYEVIIRTVEEEPDTLHQQNVLAGNSDRMQATFYGVHDEDFAENPDEHETDLAMHTIDNLVEQSTVEGGVTSKIAHFSTDLRSINLSLQDTDEIIAESLEYGSLSGYLQLDAEDQTWTMTEYETNDFINDFEMDIEQFEDETVIMQTSGFYDPGSNQDGASLIMMAIQDDGSVHEVQMATSSDEMADVPDQVELSQNYPNPFNPATTIEYAVPEESDVRLEVYNILGERVTVLVDETVQAGTHEATFDATDMASGVYIYRLQAGDETFTRQMTFVK